MVTAYSLVRKDCNDCNVGSTTSLRIDTIIRNRTTECTATVQIGLRSSYSIQPSLVRRSRNPTPPSRKHRKPFVHDIIFVNAIVTQFASKTYGMFVRRPSNVVALFGSKVQNKFDTPQCHIASRGITFAARPVIKSVHRHGRCRFVRHTMSVESNTIRRLGRICARYGSDAAKNTTLFIPFSLRGIVGLC
mgnify:CR=1 FL=1